MTTLNKQLNQAIQDENIEQIQKLLEKIDNIYEEENEGGLLNKLMYHFSHNRIFANYDQPIDQKMKLKLIKFLVAQGYPSTEAFIRKDTPLDWASREGHKDLVKLLEKQNNRIKNKERGEELREKYKKLKNEANDLGISLILEEKYYD